MKKTHFKHFLVTILLAFIFACEKKLKNDYSQNEIVSTSVTERDNLCIDNVNISTLTNPNSSCIDVYMRVVCFKFDNPNAAAPNFYWNIGFEDYHYVSPVLGCHAIFSPFLTNSTSGGEWKHLERNPFKQSVINQFWPSGSTCKILAEANSSFVNTVAAFGIGVEMKVGINGTPKTFYLHSTALPYHPIDIVSAPNGSWEISSTVIFDANCNITGSNLVDDNSYPCSNSQHIPRRH